MSDMRITLVHALKHSIVPIEASFAKLWPEARLMNLMDDPEPYQQAIHSLPELQRQFFVRDFVSKPGRKGTFDQTREQIRYRLQALIGLLASATWRRNNSQPAR